MGQPYANVSTRKASFVSYIKGSGNLTDLLSLNI